MESVAPRGAWRPRRQVEFSIWPSDPGQRVFALVILLLGPWCLLFALWMTVWYAGDCLGHGRVPIAAFLGLPLLLWACQPFVPAWWQTHARRARLMTALLAGTVLAWVLLPLSMVHFPSLPAEQAQQMHAAWDREAAGLAGCNVRAVGGFPILGICGDGGGGWRDGHLTARGTWTFAANMALLAGAAWLLLGCLPERSRRTIWWYLTWSTPSAVAVALTFMISWWD